MTATAVMTSHERSAAQAYLRLLSTVRAALDSPVDRPGAPVSLEGVIAEADEALARAGLAGNEAELFALVGSLHTGGAPAPGQPRR
ncbi:MULTISPECIES: hypothetical protein [Streptomyces]|uniref:hypothetical protein n=1 Tax=Streptomyces TaxID=1883 RepID=UPI000C27F31A|nr:hypothetical protein [Streptomyces sp. CB01201]MBX7468954.1 hypothetical protein [Streptomyces sp. MAG02]PJM98437.1 hypothetical protein CG740_35715 [Streptomyces sp. CB01201]